MPNNITANNGTITLAATNGACVYNGNVFTANPDVVGIGVFWAMIMGSILTLLFAVGSSVSRHCVQLTFDFALAQMISGAVLWMSKLISIGVRKDDPNADLAGILSLMTLASSLATGPVTSAICARINADPQRGRKETGAELIRSFGRFMLWCALLFYLLFTIDTVGDILTSYSGRVAIVLVVAAIGMWVCVILDCVWGWHKRRLFWMSILLCFSANVVLILMAILMRYSDLFFGESCRLRGGSYDTWTFGQILPIAFLFLPLYLGLESVIAGSAAGSRMERWYLMRGAKRAQQPVHSSSSVFVSFHQTGKTGAGPTQSSSVHFHQQFPPVQLQIA